MNRFTQAGLITACQNGDERGFEELFQQYHERVYRVGLRYTGNIQEAEDVTQDVFVKVFKEIIRFKGYSNFYTWLYRITVNICRDKERWQSRRYLLDKSINGGWRSGDGIEKETLEMQWQTETQKMLQNALHQLSPKLRTVIILKHIEELSLVEISQVLDCSQGTVSSRLNRGRARLRDILGKMGLDRTYLQGA
ncbi:MAG: sigma-70 family RNA polymerase sigma factor [Candidatus Marinimicrobia bacterium]|nr:sigma-70 family RNA polymerase sigma factor [Candidatus Neomarinimicrobiota bacterium]